MENKPKYFFETKRGAIIGRVVHDINNASAIVAGWCKTMNDAPEGVKQERLLSIVERMKRIQDAVDYLYDSMKKMEGYE